MVQNQASWNTSAATIFKIDQNAPQFGNLSELDQIFFKTSTLNVIRRIYRLQSVRAIPVVVCAYGIKTNLNHKIGPQGCTEWLFLLQTMSLETEDDSAASYIHTTTHQTQHTGFSTCLFVYSRMLILLSISDFWIIESRPTSRRNGFGTDTGEKGCLVLLFLRIQPPEPDRRRRHTWPQKASFESNPPPLINSRLVMGLRQLTSYLYMKWSGFEEV